MLKIKELYSFLSQSELSNFFVYIIIGFNNIPEKITQFWLAEKGVQLFKDLCKNIHAMICFFIPQ